MSLAGSGYLSGNMLIPFPFEDGQCLPLEQDGLSQEAQVVLNRCFVDAAFCSYGMYLSDSEWPSIGRIDYVYDANGPLMSIGFYIHAFGSEFRVSATAGDEKFPIIQGNAPWGTYVVTVSSEGIHDFCKFCHGNGIQSPIALSSPPATGCSSPSWQDGVFWLRVCAKCVTVRQKSLSSLMVYDGVNPSEFGTLGRGYSVGDVCWRNGFYRCTSPVGPGSSWDESDWEFVGIKGASPSFTLDGNIVVKSGNNMRLSDDDDEAGTVELNAEPGAGLGQIPCTCDDTKTPWAILMAGPDGHMRIFNDTCYDLEPSTTTGMLKMHAKCTACCTCEMYESIVNDKLKGIADSIRGYRSRIDELSNLYNDAVRRFNSRIRKPHKEDIDLSISAMPIGAKLSPKIKNKSVKGMMQRCSFSAVIRNSSFFNVSVGNLRISGTDAIVESSATWSDSSGNPMSKAGDGSAAVTSGSYVLYPGRSLVITYISVKNSKVNSVGTGGYVGSVSASVYHNSSFVGSYSKTVRV